MNTPTALVSVEDNDYCWWQMRLLRWSMKKRAPHVRLVAAVACRGGQIQRDWHDLCDQVVVAPHYLDTSVAEIDPQYYLWNKPLGMQEALRCGALSDAGPLLLLDPDMVLLTDRPFGRPSLRTQFGAIFGNLVDNAKQARVEELCGPECKDWFRDLFSPTGFPMVLAGPDSLKAICAEWFSLLATIRLNPRDREFLNWWSEMWAFSGAAAKAGVAIEVDTHWSVSTDHTGTLEGVDWLHYCNRAMVPVDKRQHDPAGGRWLGMPSAAARLVREWWEMEGA